MTLPCPVGLLRRSFIPTVAGRGLRDQLRYRISRLVSLSAVHFGCAIQLLFVRQRHDQHADHINQGWHAVDSTRWVDGSSLPSASSGDRSRSAPQKGPVIIEVLGSSEISRSGSIRPVCPGMKRHGSPRVQGVRHPPRMPGDEAYRTVSTSPSPDSAPYVRG